MNSPGSDAAARWGARAIVALVAALLVAALLQAMAGRGPWYDEFYTAYVTGGQLGFRDALVRYWLPDNHPPLFYALANGTRWLGATIEDRRALNLLIAAAAGGGALAVARAGSAAFRLLAALFFLGLAAESAVLLYGAELRSYFLSLAATAVMVLALVQLHGDRAGRKPARSTLAALWLSALVALNTHIATTIIAGATLGAFLLVALVRRCRDTVRVVLPPAVAGSLVFLAVTAVQWPQWEANTRAFWIKPGFFVARWAIEMAVIRALEANLVLLAGGAAGVVVLAWRCRRGSSDPWFECLVALGLAVAGSAAIMLAIHLVRPFVIERYLIALAPLLVMALALGLARLVARRSPWLHLAVLAAVALATSLALPATLRDVIARPSWRGTAALIGAQVRACPGTVVHRDLAANADVLALPPAENRAVVPFAYATMARRNGFTVEPLTSRRVSPHCPTLIWAEHTLDTPTAPALLARLRGRGLAVSQVTVRQIGNGWIGTARP